MADSDSSSVLSDPPSSVEEPVVFQEPQAKIKINVKQSKKGPLKQSTLSFGNRRRRAPSASPEPPLADLNREPSPPHEYVLADNPSIPVIIMFQNRFAEAFLKGVPNLGPQDIENGVVSEAPSDQVEDLLCGLLGLVLNRKKNPERGHFGRALEEALASHKGQWPPHWNGINPVPSSKTFASLNAEQRIDLLRTLVHWSLTSSDAVANTIRESYKQNRKEDDMNQPLSIQPWGTDSLKRRFYLVQGHVDTPVRVYREGDRRDGNPAWQSVGGSIADIQRLSRNLRAEKSQAAHTLAKKMTEYIPQLEDREDKRKRKEYRQNRKAAFARPEPGFSLYEGRTRGKRPRYTYDDDDIDGTDDNSNRRSARQSGFSTPAEGPRYTASGRQVRSAFGASYGEPSSLRDGTPASSGDGNSSGLASRMNGRPTRSGRVTDRRGGSYDEGYESVDELDDDNESASSGDWNGENDDPEGKFDDDEDDSSSASGDSLAEDSEPRSLVVSLKCSRLSEVFSPATIAHAPPGDVMDLDNKLPAEAKKAVPTYTTTLPLSPQRPSPAFAAKSPTFEPRSAPVFSQYAYDKPAGSVHPPKPVEPVIAETPKTNTSEQSQTNGSAVHNGQFHNGAASDAVVPKTGVSSSDHRAALPPAPVLQPSSY